VVSYAARARHQRGVDYAVVGVEGDQVVLRGGDGQNVTVKPAQHFSIRCKVTSRSRRRCYKITKSGKQLGLLSGDQVRVQQ
jgi:hypothetical protein